jgi:hypothetical protein
MRASRLFRRRDQQLQLAFIRLDQTGSRREVVLPAPFGPRAEAFATAPDGQVQPVHRHLAAVIGVARAQPCSFGVPPPRAANAATRFVELRQPSVETSAPASTTTEMLRAPAQHRVHLHHLVQIAMHQQGVGGCLRHREPPHGGRPAPDAARPGGACLHVAAEEIAKVSGRRLPR